MSQRAYRHAESQGGRTEEHTERDERAPGPNRTDYLVTLAVGVCGLMAYVRTLAPDVLYGDSAEFQTLAYTLGMTHSTGYPVYLLLARLIGFLPIGSLAWRVNLLSALGAAVTLGGVFLLARYLTRSRVGALLGSVALGLSYTFWSQAIIAELYTPATAFLCVIMLLLWRWHSALLGSGKGDGGGRGDNRALLLATLLTALGLGVHASVVLIAPAATAFVIWTLLARRLTWAQRRWSLGAAFAGLALGVGGFLLAFLLVDLNDPPSSFYQVALLPSRSLWGLEAADLDSLLERMVATVTGVQWQDAMFPDGVDLVKEFANYGGRLLSREFPPLVFLCALLGLPAMWRVARRLGIFVVVAFVTVLFFILNYQPPDKYVFYLPSYVLVATATGTGAGALLELARRYLVVPGRRRYLMVLYVGAVALLAWGTVRPFGVSRREALQAGAATFVQEDYVYPLQNLEEPRRVWSWQLEQLPDDVLLITDWRALYTMYYLAHVEGLRPDVRIVEASPHPGRGMVADSLVQELKDVLQEGRPVYARDVYRNLGHFRVLPAPGGDWYRVSLPGTN